MKAAMSPLTRSSSWLAAAALLATACAATEPVLERFGAVQDAKLLAKGQLIAGLRHDN